MAETMLEKKQQRFKLAKERWRHLRRQGAIIRPNSQKPGKMLMITIPNEQVYPIVWV
jgi:hypothetical protein